MVLCMNCVNFSLSLQNNSAYRAIYRVIKALFSQSVSLWGLPVDIFYISLYVPIYLYIREHPNCLRTVFDCQRLPPLEELA